MADSRAVSRAVSFASSFDPASAKREASSESLPPNTSDLIEWWDNRTADFTTTGGLIDTWTGRQNGLALTGTTTTRPTLVDGDGVNYVYFNSDYLDMPGTVSWDRRDSSLFVIYRPDYLDTTIRSIWHMGTSSTTDAVYQQSQELKLFNASARVTGLYWGQHLSATYRVASASGVKMGISPGETTVTANAAGTISDGYVGQWNGGSFRCVGDILAILAYNRELTGTEINEVLDWMNTYYAVEARTNTAVIQCEGDSLTEGIQSTSPRYYGYPFQLGRLKSSPPRIINGGAGGDTAQANATATRAITDFTRQSGHTKKTCVYWLGTNDINNGRTEAQVEGDIDAFITALKASHATAHIVGMTILPRGDLTAGEETIRLAVNDHILNTASFDSTIDLASDTRLDDDTDTTYFDADGIHLNDAGYGVVASLVDSHLTAQSRY